MEKYYIVSKDSSVYDGYKKYTEMSEKVNNAFIEFAKEVGFETTEYYPYTNLLIISPTNSDIEKFGMYMKKNDLGEFKKNSLHSKMWVEKCQRLNLTTPVKPRLSFIFDVFGRSRESMFMVGDVVYASLENEMKFHAPDGFQEIKASEFYKVVEDNFND